MQNGDISSSLAVVLPVYNEEMTIVRTLHQILDTLHDWRCDFEVLVVNDGSTDRTGLILDTIAATNPRVRVIHHPAYCGYAAALASGFAAVTKSLVFFMQADGEYDIRDLSAFFPLLKEYDGVVGYRIERHDGWLRQWAAWCWKILVGMVFDVYVRDVNCAFKLFPATFLREHPLETRSALFDTELLYKFTRAGYVFAQQGVRQLPVRRRTSSPLEPSMLRATLREMVFYAWKWHREEQKEADKEDQEQHKSGAKG